MKELKKCITDIIKELGMFNRKRRWHSMKLNKIPFKEKQRHYDYQFNQPYRQEELARRKEEKYLRKLKVIAPESLPVSYFDAHLIMACHQIKKLQNL